MLEWLWHLARKRLWVNDRNIGETRRLQLDSGQFDNTVELAGALAPEELEQCAEMPPFDAVAWEASATARIERRLSELCGPPLTRK